MEQHGSIPVWQDEWPTRPFPILCNLFSSLSYLVERRPVPNCYIELAGSDSPFGSGDAGL